MQRAARTFSCLAGLSVVAAGWWAAAQPEGAREPSWYASVLQSKAALSREYTFDAEIELARKVGEGQRETVAAFNVKLAAGPERRYLLWIGSGTDLRHLIVSNGREVWGFTPPLNQYVHLKAVPALVADPDLAFARGVAKDDTDPVLCSGLVLPVLATLDRHAAAVVDMRWPGQPDSATGERELPVLSVLSEKAPGVAQRFAQITLDTETFNPARLEWSKAIPAGDETDFAQLDVKFSNFQLGGPLPPAYFVFLPGAASKVDEIAIPGLNGAAVLDKPAPHFEIESAIGRITPAKLRGRTAVLAFTAKDCEPCARQKSVLADIQSEMKGRNVVILDTGDGNAQLQSLFRVHFVPTLVIIDAQGRVVRFLPGLREAGEVKSALSKQGV